MFFVCLSESWDLFHPYQYYFFKDDLFQTIGSAVRYVGVDHVVKVLSLCIDADAAILSTEFPRSWLIPVLRVNIHNAPLSLFASLFLPLAMKIYK